MRDRRRTFTWTERVLPNHQDPPEKKSLKLIILLIVAMLVLMVVLGLVTFWLSVRGAEEVLVPTLGGKELTAALMELQEKQLVPQVQVRYSSDAPKGTVLEQRPEPGAISRVGRKVTMTVSRGPVIDRVENYVGQKLEEVRSHLKAVFASYQPLLKIKEPVSYVFDDTVPEGTILSQKPEAGTVLDGVTDLELVVSRGPKGEMITVADFVGMPFEDAVAQLSSANQPFTFTVRRADAGEKSGVVVGQTPDPETDVPYGSVVQLTMTRPTGIPAGKVFGVFQYVLPDYPIMVDITLDAMSADGNTTLLAMKHPGGPISIPYIVDDKSELILYIFDKEEIRQQASAVAR
jgi:beta-lactam-binding protein with PASTA domain